jgi:hypothetical protein
MPGGLVQAAHVLRARFGLLPTGGDAGIRR